MSTIRELLEEPFGSEDVEWRIGQLNKDKTKGRVLPYVTARAVMKRLNDVFGVDGWQDNYVAVSAGKETGFMCTISVLIDGEWVSKSDGAPATNIEPIKGGFSDSFKRAAVKFGIGAWLYYMQPVWARVENGKYIAKGEYPRLNHIADLAASSYREGIVAQVDNEEVDEQQSAAPQNWRISVAKRIEDLWLDAGAKTPDTLDEISRLALIVEEPSTKDGAERIIGCLMSSEDEDKWRKRFHALGKEVFGDNWQEARKDFVFALYEIESSKDLTVGERAGVLHHLILMQEAKS